MKRLIIAVVAVAIVLPWGLPRAEAQEGFQVVVNTANSLNEIAAKDLSNLMLRKRSKWPDSNLKADPVDLDPKSSVREAFSKEVHGRGTSSIESYWQRQIFSGKGVPPPKVDNDAAVIAHVKASPGSVGYVSAGANVDGVKVLTVN
jgi:ABC-type phosphate transport system substrate-binding protein